LLVDFGAPIYFAFFLKTYKNRNNWPFNPGHQQSDDVHGLTVEGMVEIYEK
jgi:hypothetical protein